MKTFLTLSCMLAFLCMPALLKAQEKKESKTHRFFIIKDQVMPSKYFDYTEAVKGFSKFMKEKNYPYPVYVYSDDEFNFYFSYPVGKTYAHLDSLFGMWNTYYQKDKEGWDAIFDAFDEKYLGSSEYIMIWAKDLSYSPPLGFRKTIDYPFMDLMDWYILPGKMEEAKIIMKKWVKLYRENGIETEFLTYIGGLGSEQPMIRIISQFKNRTEAGKMTDETNAKLEAIEGAKELWAQTLNITRKVTNTTGWYRAKLSYIPTK